MEAAALIRRARQAAGLTLRALAARAETSHATLSAYENGRAIPRVDTLDRVLRAAGFEADLRLARRADPARNRMAKARELREALDLAGQFPARHAARLNAPIFGRPPPR